MLEVAAIMCLKLIVLFLIVVICKEIDGLRLKQVLILGRHNIRTPMGKEMAEYTRKKWPKFYEKTGLLTRKGVKLEGYMGEYFSKWFKSENIVTEKCPDKDSVYIYVNSLSRTIETAKAFVKYAFKGCEVPIHYLKNSNDSEKMDPNFSPIVRNNTSRFKKYMLKTIKHKMYNNSALKAGLSALNKILNINRSEMCKTKSICDLNDNSKNKISFHFGQELWLNGPFHVAITVVDFFTMSYYNGMPMKDVAWGLVRTSKEWETITEVARQDHDIRYRTLAQDYGAPLIKLLKLTFINYKNMPTIISIVGHDFNQISIFYGLSFRPIRLPHQLRIFLLEGK